MFSPLLNLSRRRPHAGPLIVALALLPGARYAPPNAPLEAHDRGGALFRSNIEYKRVGRERLLLDAAIPLGPGPFPAVIIVHGGGWVAGGKGLWVTSLFKPFTRGGLAWFSINYRLAPRARYPACLEDVESAVRWVREHARDYRVDPSRLVLLGESAGGYLVEWAAVRETPETRVAAVVALYAPCDLLAETRQRGVLGVTMIALFGLNTFNAAAEKVLHDASPINYAHAGMPPFLLLHGTADKTVLFEQSRRWQARLRAAGVRCDLIPIREGTHGMDRWNRLDPAYPEKIVSWLRIALPPAAPASPAAAKS